MLIMAVAAQMLVMAVAAQAFGGVSSVAHWCS